VEPVAVLGVQRMRFLEQRQQPTRLSRIVSAILEPPDDLALGGESCGDPSGVPLRHPVLTHSGAILHGKPTSYVELLGFTSA
jgi:hypothetical protein